MLTDVSHPIADGMPRIHVLPEVRVRTVMAMADGAPLNISELHIATHAGTHIDAPLHAVPGGRSIDDLSLEDVSGPGVVVPVHRQGGEEITVEDVRDAGPEVRRGDIVLLSTGWGAKFHDEAYGDHPYPSVELARWLVEMGIKMLGVDCITVDAPPARRGPDFAFPVHRTLLGHDVLIAENLTRLDRVAGQRVVVYAFPLAVQGGDAGHARIVVATGDQ